MLAKFQAASAAFRGSAAGTRVLETAEIAQGVVAVLPEAHGQLHAWPCQVRSHLMM